jgi:hypothetical protein
VHEEWALEGSLKGPENRRLSSELPDWCGLVEAFLANLHWLGGDAIILAGDVYASVALNW